MPSLGRMSLVPHAAVVVVYLLDVFPYYLSRSLTPLCIFKDCDCRYCYLHIILLPLMYCGLSTTVVSGWSAHLRSLRFLATLLSDFLLPSIAIEPLAQFSPMAYSITATVKFAPTSWLTRRHGWTATDREWFLLPVPVTCH
jgi:hypothetical protein